MDIDKPDTLSITNQPLDWGGTLYQSFTIGLGFDLVTTALLPADKAWGDAMKNIASGDCMDMGLPKKQPEWLLAGSATSAGGAPVPGMVVDVSVGQSHRRLLVQNVDDKNRPTPFTSMPITWTRTWGAPDNPENPLGCGIVPDPETGTIKYPSVTDANLPHKTPACCGSLGAWPCRIKNMGTYDAEWLKHRWPGVPDDFDWAFFNLAQPSQRLHSPLLIDETIVLRSLHPDHPEIVSRLPGRQVLASFRTKAAPEEWKEMKITPDTLWLFPNDLTGIILWHGLVPCADEIGSDILAVRLRLDPAEASPVPSVAVDPGKAAELADLAPAVDPSGVVTDTTEAPTAAGLFVAGGAVAAGAATVAAATDSSSSKTPQAAPSQPEQETASPQPAASAADTPPPPAPEETTSRAEQQAIAQLRNDALADMDDTISEVNKVLADIGLPPLTPEQVAETQERVVTVTDSMQQSLAAVENQPTDPTVLLQNAGVPQDRINAFNSALELDPPSPDDHADPVTWKAAVEAYMQQFETLLQPPSGVSNTMRTMFEIMGPGGSSKLEELSGAEPSIESMLVQSGVAASDAATFARWAEAEDEVIPGIDDMRGLSAYATELEKRLGFPSGSVSSRIDAAWKAMHDMGLTDSSPDDNFAASDNKAEKDPGVDTPKTPETAAAPSPAAVPSTTAQADTKPQAEGASLKASAPQPAAASSKPSLDRAGVVAVLLAGGTLVAANMTSADLSGLNLAGQDLSGALLAESNLVEANLSGAKLVGADLSGANATSAQFVNAQFAEAKLCNVLAPDADFTGADLTNSVFTQANLQSATLHDIRGTGLRADNACLAKAKLRFCTLDHADFTGADLAEADFHQAVLDNACFRNATLTRTSFCHNTTVSGASFVAADLSSGAWKDVIGERCTFTGARASGTGFNDCNFTASSWRGAIAQNADFSRCNLDNADLRSANLFKASMREANVENADLSGTNLYGSDLYRLRMNDATRTDGTNFNSTIIAARKESC